MDNSKESNQTGGVTASALLGIAFVILKLCGVINWSWWWVLLPFYGALAILLLILIIGFIITIIRN